LAREAHRELDTFRHAAEEQILDKRGRILSFARQHLCVRALDLERLGTVILAHRYFAAVAPGQRCATVPYLRPGGDVLLRLSGWPKVERVLQIVDAVEAPRHRPGRRSARLLAPRPQSSVRQ